MGKEESVCAILSPSHYRYLVNEVWKNGAKGVINNRRKGDPTENTERDIMAIQEIAETKGFRL